VKTLGKADPTSAPALEGCRMGINFAIDELYATGWSALDTAGCEQVEGRWVPSVERVRDAFTRRGLALSIRHVQLFDCFRAEWSDAAGAPIGAVVGQSESEAAIFALAHVRRGVTATSPA
jgi:hypothetical protein